METLAGVAVVVLPPLLVTIGTLLGRRLRWSAMQLLCCVRFGGTVATSLLVTALVYPLYADDTTRSPLINETAVKSAAWMLVILNIVAIMASYALPGIIRRKQRSPIKEQSSGHTCPLCQQPVSEEMLQSFGLADATTAGVE